MTLSVDTNVFIEVIRKRNPLVRRAFAEAISRPGSVVASLIVYQELLFGTALHHDPIAQREAVRMALDRVAIEPFDLRDMSAIAAVRADLRRRGETIGSYDVLIAGQALARGWTVVTNNTREFRRIAGLDVVDWASPSAVAPFS